MIVIKNKKGDDAFGIKRDGERNYELFSWSPEHAAEKNGRNTTKGDIIPAKWVSLGIYPSTLEYAIQVIYDILVAEKSEKPRKDLVTAIDDIAEIRNSLIPMIAEQLKKVKK